MSYTDQQLKLALAKMLPTELDTHGGCVEWHILEEPVQDREWLHVCWLIEQSLSNSQQEDYLSKLESCIGTCRSWEITHASWQQRAIALAKTLNIDIT